MSGGRGDLAEYFLDTSAFVKRYHPEAGTNTVLALFNAPQNRLYISRLSIVETRSAFAMKVRTKEIPESTAMALWSQLLFDLATGVFEVLPVMDHHYQAAEQLIGNYGFRYRLRTLDALQLSIALDRNRQVALDAFVLADMGLSEVVAAEQMPVLMAL
jgi:predicted nucleic acid-binding protein